MSSYLPSNQTIRDGLPLFLTSILSTLYIQKKNNKKNDDSLDFVKNLKREVCISCPGKVLIAGGYLVLERPNVGVTVAGTSRFYSTVKFIEDPSLKTEKNNEENKNNKENIFLIKIFSPQFYEEYEYEYNLVTNELKKSQNSKENLFVEKCLKLTFLFINEYYNNKLNASTDLSSSTSKSNQNFINNLLKINQDGYLGIKLQADNDFYSQINKLLKENKPLLSSSLLDIPKFSPCPIENGEIIIAKTGLGSSAALVTSLIGSILQWFGIVRLGYKFNEEDRRIIHNLSQIVHANAQGKIGSGFDVSSAVYGTHVYTRFSPEPFSPCMEENVDSKTLYNIVVNNFIYWDQEIHSFQLPYRISIVLGDVCGGSSSTSMAKKVLEWKKSYPNAELTWKKLGIFNKQISDCFRNLNQMFVEKNELYINGVEELSQILSSEWKYSTVNPVINLFIELRNSFASARQLLKQIGEEANVEIEPENQTHLINATINTVPGVLACGCPGAGGHDAIFSLTLSEIAREGVEELWSKWKENEANKEGILVCPLLLRESNSDKVGIQAEFEMNW